MEIYLISIVLIFVFGLIQLCYKNLKVFNKLFSLILYVFLVVTIGLRWETGVDWNNYLNNFENTNNFETALINIIGGYEIGYGVLVLIFKKISNNYSFFLLIHALFFYWGIFRMGKKYSPYFFICILFYYCTNLGMVGSNRQLIAIVICLWGLDFVFEKKIIKFVLTIIFASLFHTSAFLFIIYYFFDRDFNKLILILFLFFFIIIGKTELPSFLFSKFGGYFGELSLSKTQIYSDSILDNLKTANLSFFGLLKRIILFSIFTYTYNSLSPRLSYYKLLYNGYFFGIAIYFLFASSFLILVNRGALYFNIMECCLISCQFILLRNKPEQIFIFIILFFVSIGLLVQSISTYPDLFDPYKALFYNTSFNREMY
jgi:hypothetical protein